MWNVSRCIMLTTFSLFILTNFASTAPHANSPVTLSTDGPGPVTLVNGAVADDARESREDVRQNRVPRSPKMMHVKREEAGLISSTEVVLSSTMSLEKRSPKRGSGGGGGGGRGGGGAPAGKPPGGQLRSGRDAAKLLKKEVAVVSKSLDGISGESGATVSKKLGAILKVVKEEDKARKAIEEANKRNPRAALDKKLIGTNDKRLEQELEKLRQLGASGASAAAVEAQLRRVNEVRKPLKQATGDLIKVGESGR